MPWRPRKVGQVSPSQAHQRLVEGNHRFAAHAGDERRRQWDPRHAQGQVPIAAVLGCADSRAPAELVFDQGLGDLFVVRNAGNVVAPSVTGSIEFAVHQLGVPLVVVLGHTSCGAIGATVHEIEEGIPPINTESVLRITGRIRPHVEPIVAAQKARAGGDVDAMLRQCMRANASASLQQLKTDSELLRDAVAHGTLWMLAAEYDLETGVVRFLP